MTLIIAAKRDSFAVLAADGLWMPSGEDFPKIVCHPSSLPIACTMSGLAALLADTAISKKCGVAIGQPVRTTDFIRDVLEQFPITDNLTTEHICERLAARLGPLVNKDHYLACHVAMVKNNSADVSIMWIGLKEKCPPGMVDRGGWFWSQNGIEFYTPESHRDLLEEELRQAYVVDVNTADELAVIMRTIVEKAIAKEQMRNLSKPTIGGTPSIAKITSQGASIIPWPHQTLLGSS